MEESRLDRPLGEIEVLRGLRAAGRQRSRQRRVARRIARSDASGPESSGASAPGPKPRGRSPGPKTGTEDGDRRRAPKIPAPGGRRLSGAACGPGSEHLGDRVLGCGLSKKARREAKADAGGAQRSSAEHAATAIVPASRSLRPASRCAGSRDAIARWSHAFSGAHVRRGLEAPSRIRIRRLGVAAGCAEVGSRGCAHHPGSPSAHIRAQRLARCARGAVRLIDAVSTREAWSEDLLLSGCSRAPGAVHRRRTNGWRG